MKATDVWQEYYKMVVPKNANPIQVQETRRAFYAGMYSMLQMSRALTVLDDDDAVEELGNLNEELEQFSVDVANGKA